VTLLKKMEATRRKRKKKIMTINSGCDLHFEWYPKRQ